MGYDTLILTLLGILTLMGFAAEAPCMQSLVLCLLRSAFIIARLGRLVNEGMSVSLMAIFCASSVPPHNKHTSVRIWISVQYRDDSSRAQGS